MMFVFVGYLATFSYIYIYIYIIAYMAYLNAIDLKVTEPNTPTKSALQHASGRV